LCLKVENNVLSRDNKVPYGSILVNNRFFIHTTA